MNHRRALLLAVAIPACFLGSTTTAGAQSTPAGASAPATPASTPGNETTTDARALAETLFFTGRGLMEGGRFAQACEKFAESYRLDAAAGTLLNLAVCHEKAGRLASAWGEFRQCLAEARRSNRPEREQLAKDAIARLEPDLPFVTIVVPKETRVPGLQILRNGVPLLEAAWDTELPIDPGTNEITATAPDYKPEKKTVTAAIRQHVTVTVDPLELAPIIRPPPPFWTAKRELGLGLMIGGVAVAGTGAVFGGLALGKKSTSDTNCPTFDGELRCTQAGADAMSTARTYAWVADFGIGVGAAAVIAGAVLYATGGAKEQSGPSVPASSAKNEGHWDWRMNAGPHGAQGVLSRSF